VIGTTLGILYLARKEKLNWLRVHDYVACCVPFGLFFGRVANFINAELWGRTSDVPWAMVFPHAGPLPRHPSQLYEAALEGVVLGVALWFCMRAGALKRPGLVIGLFAVGYSIARIICEFFREPDPQLGFLWGGLTMGMLLSVPLMLTGFAFIAAAMKRPPLQQPA
jgi:phosphatidylglycerol:prolipoprotein diacylglycerol transferase